MISDKKQEFNRRLRAVITLFVILALLAAVNLTSVMTAKADDYVYYQTWEEYQAAGGTADTWVEKANVIGGVLDYAVTLFEQGILTKDDGEPNAYDVVNKGGYYGYYETTGFERNTMGRISGARVSAVELQFSTTRKIAKKAGTLDEFKENVETLKAMILEDGTTMDIQDGVAVSSTENTDSAGSGTSTSAAALVWTACFTIILREGFEAILIVGAIVAYLQVSAGNDKKERQRKTRPIYIGAIVGIIASFVLAAILNAIQLANSASQEIIEGVTALIAVCVLYYVSNWMLSKSETDAWTGYIKKKVASSSEKGSMFALAFTAFLAVFREGAEVVLFYQPWLNQGNDASVWSGFIFGCICLVIVWLIIKLLSVKIPIKPFFTATSILMFIMSISFLGAGIKELIEGGLIEAQNQPWLMWIPTTDFMDMLGIYPMLETLIPQLILLIVTVVIFVVVTKKNRRIHAEAEVQRAAEQAIREAEEKAAREEALTGYITNVVNQILADKGLIDKLPEADAQALAQKAQSVVEQAGDAIANAGDIARNA